MPAPKPSARAGMCTGNRYALPSGRVVQVQRIVQQDGEFVAICRYLRDGVHPDRQDESSLRADWLQQYGRVTG